MKFPLPKNIFPTLELTEIQEQTYEQLANALIKATLAEYDRFVTQDRKRVDVRRWKAVRARDGVTIYQEREMDGESQEPARATLALYRSTVLTASSQLSQNTRCSAPLTSDTISVSSRHSFIPPSPKKYSDLDPIEDSRRTAGYDSYSSGDLLVGPRITTASYSRADDSSNRSGLPRLLAVGTLRGSLDDVMYGVVSPDASSVRLRSSYLGEHIADCAVLREIKSPSSADPFRFLGIKWFVRAKHRGAARILLPRDFVVLEYSGVMMRPDNSRVGFHLMHSVEISSCRQLLEHHILRAKLSSCYIYEETRNNCVQVFMTASVDPSGYVFTRMAMRSAAIALSSCWKAISCAHDKKLAFCLQNERPSTMGGIRSSRGNNPSATRSSRGGLSALTPVNESGVRDSTATESVSQRSNYSSTANSRRCGVCRDKLRLLSKVLSCQLCSEQICNRCRIERKLSCDTLNSKVTQSLMNFCKKCVAIVSDESALEIARQELWVRARSHTRASSANVRRNSRHSLSTERNTYAAVILGRTSDPVGRSSNTTRSFVFSSAASSMSQERSTHLEESSMGYSVGPLYSLPSTQLSTPVKGSNPSNQMSKNSLLPVSNVSTSSLMSGVQMNEALSLTDLHLDKSSIANKTVAATVEKNEVEEPVVLDHRLTSTLRNLRHLDYVLSVDEQDIGDVLENDDLESEDYGEFESGDEGETRSSYASSVAVLDDDFAMSATSTSNVFKHESPIVEVQEDEESEMEVKFEQDKVEKAVEIEECEQNANSEQIEVDTAAKDGNESNKVESDGLSDDDHEIQHLDLEMSNKVEESEENNEERSVTTEVMGDNDQLRATLNDDVEVVDAAPVAEDHAMTLSQYEMQMATSEPESKDLEARLPRAHATAPSGGSDSNYQHQLFQQMQDLHNVVESTYQVARANTEAALKKRDSGRILKTSPDSKTEKSARTFYQPFAFNVVGLRSTRAMTVGVDK